jgi:hypothetical protein
MKRPLTDRQLAIVEYILKCKRKGDDVMSLDDISDMLKSKGFIVHRNSLIVTMNILIKTLTDQGVYIKKLKQMGRGARQFYAIRRYIA